MGSGGTLHYGERGSNNFRMLVTGTQGQITTANGVNDLGIPIQFELWEPCFDAGDERAQKIFGDYILDVNTGNVPLVLETWKDNYTVQVQTDTVQNLLRDLALVDLANGDGIESRNLGLKLRYSGASGKLLLYSWQPSFYTQPENITLRAPDWDYGSKSGAEWFQGLLIAADTRGLDVILRLEFDQGDASRTITINHNGYREQFYPVPGAPVVAHLARARQVGSTTSFKNFLVTWVTETYPEQSTSWNSQPQGSEIPGWKHLRECWITCISTAPAILTVTLDGSRDFSFPLPSTNGEKRQIYVPLMGEKCRIWAVDIECPAPLTLFEKDSIFHIGPWGRSEQYVKVRPFGGPNADNLSQAYK